MSESIISSHKQNAIVLPSWVNDVVAGTVGGWAQVVSGTFSLLCSSSSTCPSPLYFSEQVFVYPHTTLCHSRKEARKKGSTLHLCSEFMEKEIEWNRNALFPFLSELPGDECIVNAREGALFKRLTL